MVIDTAPAVTGTQLGYARVNTAHQSLNQQIDALTAAGLTPPASTQTSFPALRPGSSVPVSLRCWTTRGGLTPSSSSASTGSAATLPK